MPVRAPCRFLAAVLAGLAPLLCEGCPGSGADTYKFDFDGDGWDDEDDCEPDDPAVHPEADDPYGDGEDTDCDGLDGVDADRDGYPVEDGEYTGAYTAWDCNDANAHIHPGAEDFVGDEIDNNCDGPDGLDQDGDGPVVTLSGQSSAARLQGVTVQNGDAGDGQGGGIFIDGSPTLTSVTVRDCLAGEGGGIYAYNAGGTWTDVIVADNEAPMLGDNGGRGGGAFLGTSLPTCEGCAFLRNEAGWQGGGLFVESPSTPLSGLTVAYNHGPSNGGGIFARGDVVLEHVRVERNRGGHGGGYLPATSVVIRDCQFIHNQTSNTGGGITLSATVADVRDSLFVSNEGIGLEVAQNTALTVERVLIADNTGAGAELMFAPPATFAHTVFRNNGGAAISATNNVDQVDVRDSVFEGNGGTVEADPGLCTLERIVLWDNVTDQTACDVNTVLAVEPQFGSTFSQDPLEWALHLEPTSPLVDAGSVVDPDPDGSPADIGLHGGPGAGSRDLDQDGYAEWWQPGDYDFVTYPGLGWDCDDRDATVYPGSGC